MESSPANTCVFARIGLQLGSRGEVAGRPAGRRSLRIEKANGLLGRLKLSMIEHPGRVILTYGRSLMALVIARSLARRGVEVIGCDDVALTVLSFSKHVRETFTVAPWESRPGDFLDDLEAAVRNYAPRDGRPYVLMPVFRDLELIAAHRERFEPLIKVAAPDLASLDLVHPKDHLASLVEKVGLPAPATLTVRSSDQAIPAEVRYPVVVKPADGVGGRGVTIARDRDALLAQVEAAFAGPVLIQEFVAGDDYCVAALAENGQIRAVMAYKNIATFPRKAGAGAIRESVDAEPFKASLSKLLLSSRWSGVCEVDYRWDGQASSIPKIIEVNARFWAGIFHSIETGVDFPWLLFCQSIGRTFPEPAPDIGVVTKTPALWLLSTLEDVAASDPHLNAAGDAWRRAKSNLSTGKLAAAMEEAVSALGQTASAGQAMETLSEAIGRHRGAPSELSSDTDPLVGLGALFVLSHLVRHRSLPPEITYSAASRTEPRGRRSKRRPVIGITKPEHGDLLSFWAMKFAVWLAGGKAVGITASAPRNPMTIDALIFGGGSDIYPARYDATPKPGYVYDLERGDMEASWAASARRHDIPVLGVCRGAQMLNVFAGGTLSMDLSGYHRPISARGVLEPLFLRKPVWVASKSKLGAILGTAHLKVNAIHNQAIDRVGASLRVVAREPNGIVQAVEDSSRTFWIGVQFHPELMIYRKPFRDLFRRLVEAATARADDRHSGRLM